MNRRLHIELAFLLCTSVFLAGPSCDEEGPAKPPAPSANREEAPGFIGKWLMTKEEPADGKGGFFEQKRRLLEFRQSGEFTAENAYNAIAGKWRMVKGGVAVDLEIGEQKRTLNMELERVTDKQLVLIEDLPEIYLQDGPPRRVRNTYRMVSVHEFGPMLGKEIKRNSPKHGAWAAEYNFSMSKYPTMEIHFSKGIRGAGRIKLSEGGESEACFGAVLGERSSFSKYVPGETENRVETDESRHLLGLVGTWKKKGKEFIVTFDKQAWNSCKVPPETTSSHSPVELSCFELAPNEKLPSNTLACRIAKGPHWLNLIAINPADTERAGPYTFQSDPMGRIETDPGRPWLLLGKAPGLQIESTDDRDNPTPKLNFLKKKVLLNEKMFTTQVER